MILTNTIIWFGFFVLAFLNGTLREVFIKKIIMEPWAHHLSALTGILFFTVYLYFVWEKTKIQTEQEAILIGVYWFVLTILAETFIVSRFIGKQSWKEILNNYNLFAGQLWPLVVLWIGIMPYLFLTKLN